MQMPETESFRLIIPRKGNAELLMVQKDGKYSLPQVEIPKWQRVAENLTVRVEETWGLEAICLFNPAWEEGAPAHAQRNYQVMEPRNLAWQPPDNLQWVNKTQVNPGVLACPKEFDVLQLSLRRADAFNSGAAPGPFAKSGWLDELIAWVRPQLSPLGLTLTGKLKQLNASPFFSLIRLETDGRAVWFKAVGEPNLHEFAITTALAQSHPQYFPRIIATRPDWHAWLMEEVSGTHLDDVMELRRWKSAAHTLASLQVNCAGRADELLQAGCKDRRIQKILDAIDPFLEVMAELMQQQPKTPPPILTRQELLELGKRLKDACHRLQAVGLPDSLGHCDFNPGNIMVTLDRCVFIDWAEAYVGPPFATFEYLLAHLRKGHPENASWQDILRRSYGNRWEGLATSEQISEALAVTPLVAVLIYALGGDGWKNPERVRNLNFAKYMRSLVRRMQREALSLEASGVLCASY